MLVYNKIELMMISCPTCWMIRFG